MIDDKEICARLRLIRTHGVGPATYLQLMRRFGSGESAIAAFLEITARAGNESRPLTLPSQSEIESEIEAGTAVGARLLWLGDSDYPGLLAEIDSPPPALWALGDPARLHERAVAIVGSRNCSALGKRFATRIGYDLAAEGLAIVSGLARGIDGAAHRGTLDGCAGEGTAICVNPGGVDVAYPPEHRDLHAEICEKGVVFSEIRMGEAPTQVHFRRRNRLISGLAAGVVVVESAARSGTLITASSAGEQGREVMAVPGHPTDPRAAGCNKLIRDGATLIRSAEDVLETLSGMFPESPPIAPTTLFDFREADASYDAASHKAVHAAILARLSPSPIALDAVLRDIDAAESDVMWAITELEICGAILRAPGGMVSLHPNPGI